MLVGKSKRLEKLGDFKTKIVQFCVTKKATAEALQKHMAAGGHVNYMYVVQRDPDERYKFVVALKESSRMKVTVVECPPYCSERQL